MAILPALLGIAILVVSVSGSDAQSTRETIKISATEELLANIGKDNVELVLATISTDVYDDAEMNGRYVLSPCPDGEEQERGSSPCGQLEQGSDSVLRGEMALEFDSEGVPTREAVPGAIIDCSALPPSPLEFSCLRMGNGSAVRGVTIINGHSRPEPDEPGGASPVDNRNGIMIPAGGSETIVENVHVMNARRGVVATAESGMKTHTVVRNLLIEGTELAGVFFWATTPQFAPTTGSRHVGTVEASRFSEIGVHPIIFEWGFFGKDNFGNVTIRGNVIDESNRFGVSLILNSQLDSQAQGNGAVIDMRNNRVNSDLAILVNLAGAGAGDNCLAASINGNAIAGSETSLNVLIASAGSGNRVEFEFSNNSYSPERPPLTPGPQRTAVNVADDPDNDFRFSGSFGDLQRSNRRFDFGNVDLKTDFTHQPFDPQKCR
jgi:hypothetical protein